MRFKWEKKALRHSQRKLWNLVNVKRNLLKWASNWCACMCPVSIHSCKVSQTAIDVSLFNWKSPLNKWITHLKSFLQYEPYSMQLSTVIFIVLKQRDGYFGIRFIRLRSKETGWWTALLWPNPIGCQPGSDPRCAVKRSMMWKPQLRYRCCQSSSFYKLSVSLCILAVNRTGRMLVDIFFISCQI